MTIGDAMKWACAALALMFLISTVALILVMMRHTRRQAAAQQQRDEVPGDEGSGEGTDQRQ